MAGVVDVPVVAAVVVAEAEWVVEEDPEAAVVVPAVVVEAVRGVAVKAAAVVDGRAAEDPVAEVDPVVAAVERDRAVSRR
jgi:hypothetical protein